MEASKPSEEKAVSSGFYKQFTELIFGALGAFIDVLYRDKIFMYYEHPIAGPDIQC